MMAHPADLSTPSRTSPAARSPRLPVGVYAAAVTGLLQQALDVHGGPERWRAAQQVRVRLRSGGRMVVVRLQGRTIAAADAGREPRCVSGPMPRGWSSADSRALATAATSTGGRSASKPVPAAG